MWIAVVSRDATTTISIRGASDKEMLFVRKEFAGG